MRPVVDLLLVSSEQPEFLHERRHQWRSGVCMFVYVRMRACVRVCIVSVAFFVCYIETWFSQVNK